MVIYMKEIVSLTFPIFFVLFVFFLRRGLKLFRVGAHWVGAPDDHWDKEEQIKDGKDMLAKGWMYMAFALVMTIGFVVSARLFIETFNVIVRW